MTFEPAKPTIKFKRSSHFSGIYHDFIIKSWFEQLECNPLVDNCYRVKYLFFIGNNTWARVLCQFLAWQIVMVWLCLFVFRTHPRSPTRKVSLSWVMAELRLCDWGHGECAQALLQSIQATRWIGIPQVWYLFYNKPYYPGEHCWFCQWYRILHSQMCARV